MPKYLKQLKYLFNVPLIQQGLSRKLNESDDRLKAGALIARILKKLGRTPENNKFNDIKKCLEQIENDYHLSQDTRDLFTNFLNTSLALLNQRPARSEHVILIIKDLQKEMKSLRVEDFSVYIKEILEDAYFGLTHSIYQYTIYKAIKKRAMACLRQPDSECTHAMINYFLFQHGLNNIKPSGFQKTYESLTRIFSHSEMKPGYRQKSTQFLTRTGPLEIIKEWINQLIELFKEDLNTERLTEDNAKFFLKQLYTYLEGPVEEKKFTEQFTANFIKNDNPPHHYTLLRDNLFKYLFFHLIKKNFLYKKRFIKINCGNDEIAFYLLDDQLELSWITLNNQGPEGPTHYFFLEYFARLERDKKLEFLKKIMLLRSDQLSALEIQSIVSRCLPLITSDLSTVSPSLLFKGMDAHTLKKSGIQDEVLLWWGLQFKENSDALLDYFNKSASEKKASPPAGGPDRSNFIPTDILIAWCRRYPHKKPILFNECECFKNIKWTKGLLIHCYKMGIRNFSGHFTGLDLSGLDLSEASFKGATFNACRFGKNNRSRTRLPRHFEGATIDQMTFEQFVRIGVRNFNGVRLIGQPEADEKSPGIDLTAWSGKSLSFHRAKLINANLKNMNIAYFDLSYADLQGADLTNADATRYCHRSSWSNLYQSNLAGAKLHDFKVDHQYNVQSGMSYGLETTMDYQALSSFIEGTPHKNLRGITLVANSETEKQNFCELSLNHAQLGANQVRQFVSFERKNFNELDLSYTNFGRKPNSSNPPPVLDFKKGTTFNGSDLKRTNFNRTDLTNANFYGAKLGRSFAEHSIFANSTYEPLFKLPPYLPINYDHKKKSRRYQFLSYQGKDAIETFKNLLSYVYLENNTPNDNAKRSDCFASPHWDYFYSADWNRLKHFSWQHHYIDEVKKIFEHLDTLDEHKSSGPSDILTNQNSIDQIVKDFLGEKYKTMKMNNGLLKEIVDFCIELEGLQTDRHEFKRR